MEILVTTTFTIEGCEIIEYKGLVTGITVRAPTIKQSFLGILKSTIGGSIGSYTKMCEQTRYEAFKNMLKQAHSLGANAIIGIHYDSSDISANTPSTEVFCYGTAVVISKKL
ncbi:Heavy-metal-binding protein [Rickettsiales bacterium Ac37b]|nr:Heavy-metal-binding protein [Rickettsiales bacterium Ac37b]